MANRFLAFRTLSTIASPSSKASNRSKNTLSPFISLPLFTTICSPRWLVPFILIISKRTTIRILWLLTNIRIPWLLINTSISKVKVIRVWGYRHRRTSNWWWWNLSSWPTIFYRTVKNNRYFRHLIIYVPRVSLISRSIRKNMKNLKRWVCTTALQSYSKILRLPNSSVFMIIS